MDQFNQGPAAMQKWIKFFEQTNVGNTEYDFVVPSDCNELMFAIWDSVQYYWCTAIIDPVMLESYNSSGISHIMLNGGMISGTVYDMFVDITLKRSNGSTKIQVDNVRTFGANNKPTATLQVYYR